VQSIPTIDLYRELEVDPAATTGTIEAAWKSLLKRHHPDVAADHDAADERVKRINLAHEWLTDPRRRDVYDRSRRRPTVVGLTVGQPVMHQRPTQGARGSFDARVVERGRSGSPVEAARGRSQLPSYLVPIALLSVLSVVAAASFLAQSRGPGQSNTSAQVATAAPSAAATVRPGGSVGGVASSPDRGGPPSQNIARDLPAACAQPDIGAAARSPMTVGGLPGQIVAVRCGGSRSFGPLLYVATATGGWRLLAGGTLRDGFVQQAFSGRLTEPTGAHGDEFGLAWTSGEGTTSTLILYRATEALSAFWDSSDAGLSWDLARYAYQSFADPSTGGFLVITSADLSTGTCLKCHDHTLYREFYAWSTQAPGGPGLVRTSRQPFGVGP
jgi:hypothetical protein